MSTEQPLPSRADVVIIGGGIAGAASAYYLSRRGARAVLVERGEIATEQSSRAWGFVRKQGRHPAEVPLAKLASQMWEGLATELGADVEFVRGGILALAETRTEIERFEEGARVAAEHGLSTRLVDPEEIRRIIPGLAGPWSLGLYTADDGHAEPVKTTRAFAAAAARHGAVVCPGVPALSIAASRGRVDGVHTPGGLIRAEWVLCAAGIHTARLVHDLRVSVPVQVVRTSVAETRTASPPITRTAVWGPYVAFRPTPRGTFYLGEGHRGTGADYDVTLASFRHLRHFLPNYVRNRKELRVRVGRPLLADVFGGLTGKGSGFPGTGLPREPPVNREIVAESERRFYELLPALSNLGVQRTWAGYIDLTPDLIPVIGETGAVRNLVLASGFSGHGFALGPVVGRLVSELILGDEPAADIRPFRPGRFTDGEVIRARRVL